jgi:hypothetical protein
MWLDVGYYHVVCKKAQHAFLYNYTVVFQYYNVGYYDISSYYDAYQTSQTQGIALTPHWLLR